MDRPSSNYHRVIGIDLGTTYSAVAAYNEYTLTTELLLNRADGDAKTTPSVISRDPVLRKAIVGRAAKDNLPNDPQNTVVEIKREMGEEFGPETLTKYNAAGVFSVGDPVKVYFDGLWLMPQEISAFTLMRMKQVAEEVIGAEIQDAVVTVPAYFKEKQKKATQEAALLAGLYPRQLIPEPTAAAICYGVDRGEPEKRRYLVYDLGGGTFDVSIIQVEEAQIEVIATSGDPRLGGSNFDDAIADWAVNQLRRPPYGLDLRNDARARAIIKLRAEGAKILLSTYQDTPLALPELNPQNPPSLVLTREKLLELIEPFLRRSLTKVDEAIGLASDKGIAREDLDAILLVGGSSRIPRVKTLLLDYFRRDENFVRADTDPGSVVARGAALLAYRFAPSPSPFDIRRPVDNTLVNVDADDQVRLQLITEHSLGMGVPDIFHPIIVRGANIPISVTMSVTNAGPTTEIEVQIFQGEGRYVHENTLIGTMHLGPIEPREAGYHRFEITFSLDVNGLLGVVVHHLNTGRTYAARFEHKTGVGGIDALAVMRDKLLKLYGGTMPAVHVPPPQVVVQPPAPPQPIVLLTDPVGLRQRLDQLTALKKARRLTPEGADAFAECSFRIAVSAGTPVREALRLLKRAHKLDGVNPKYAYHIARLYFVHGELDRAASWLQAAVGQCPTSHRLWTHVSLLQRELNERYRGKEEYEPDDLRRRSADVDTLVREGVDRFERRLLEFSPRRSARARKDRERSRPSPPATSPALEAERAETSPAEFPSNVRRLTDSGKCRWSGVRDLALEDLLLSEVSDYTRNQMLPHVKYAARVAESRQRGVSAFIVLAIEWLVCGYPLETVLRLRQTLSPTLRTPSLGLFDLVSEICREERGRLPQRLADASDGGDLPPLLTALLHRRILLSSSLVFRDVGKYRAARRFLTEVRRQPPTDEEATARLRERARMLAHDLQRATKTLVLRTPDCCVEPDASQDFQPDATAAAGTLDALDHAAVTLGHLRDAAVRFLKSRLARSPLSPAEAAQLSTDRTIYKEIAQELTRTAETASDRLDGLLAAAFADRDGTRGFGPLGERAIRCRQALNHVLYSTALPAVLRQLDAALASLNDAGHMAPPPISPNLGAILAAIPLALPSSPGADVAVSHDERITAVRRQVEEIETELGRKWSRLRELLATQKRGQLSEPDLEACAAIRAYVGRVETTREAALKQLEEARAAQPAPSMEALKVLDETVAKLQNIQLGPFRANLKFPAAASSPGEIPAQPGTAESPTTSGPTTGTDATGEPGGSATAQPAARSGGGESAVSDPKGLGALEDAVRELERSIDGLFERANATFGAYSPRARDLPPIQALRMSIRARQAETLYRIRRRRDARTIWASLVREDRLDANALKNIAIGDTHGSETGRALASWRAYAELLYFFDVLAGSPRPHARVRADFHRAYGHAFAPAFLFETTKEAEPKVDERALISFLDTPSRVREFVDHTMLEQFNAKFDFTSPPLILGIRRTEGEDARKRAREHLLAFAEDVRPLLLERIREAFTDTVRGHIEAAFEACSSPQQLTQERDPAYVREEETHENWVKAVCVLKYRILVAVRGSQELPKSLGSLDFLTHLARLDRIPIRQSAGFLDAVARQFKLQDGTVLAELMSHLRDHVCHNLLQFIFGAGAEAGEDTLRRRQYRHLLETWIKQPALAGSEWLEKIDDPQPYYPEHVRAAYRDQNPEPPERAMATLGQWSAQYPELTGPARLLAILLANQRKFQEAIAVLERARNAGFLPKGRQQCVDLLRQLGVQKDNEALEAGHYVQALPSLLERLAADDLQPDLAQTVIGTFVQLARQAQSIESHGQMAQAVEAWLARARARLEQAREEGRETDVTGEALQAVEGSLNQALAQMFLVSVGELGEQTDWTRVAQAMTQLLAVHPGVVDAYYYRMVAWNRLAAQAKDRETFRERGQRALADSKVVKARSRNDDHRQQAEDLALQVEQLLSRP